MADQFDREIQTWHEQHEEITRNPHSSREDYERILNKGSELLRTAVRERNSVKESYQAAIAHLI